MISYICQISNGYICRLFDDASSSSFVITGEYPEELRVVYLFAECCISFLLYQFHDVCTLIEIITRYDDELSRDVSLECEDRSTRTRLLSLLDIVYFFSLVLTTKVFPETLRLVPYNHKNLIEILNNRLDIVFDDGLATDSEKWLRSIISERAHTRSFSGSHDDEVHRRLAIMD